MGDNFRRSLAVWCLLLLVKALLHQAEALPFASSCPARRRPAGVACCGLRGWLRRKSVKPPAEPVKEVAVQTAPQAEPVAEDVAPRKEGFMRESQFWRWTGALGWSLNFILLCWALFLRRAGLVDQGQEDDAELKYDSSTYADLVASSLQEESYVSESNEALGTVLERLGSSLEALRQRAEEILKPTEEKFPSYDEVVISKRIGELQAVFEDQRQILGRETAEVLSKLQQKPELLRQLDDITPAQRPNQGLLPEELPRLLEESGLPVLAVLGSSFVVALLSRQFLRVDWRKNEEEQRAAKVRKIQKQRFEQFTKSLQESLEELAKGRLAKAARGFDKLASFADRWASEPTWEEQIRAESSAFWESWGPQAWRLEADIKDWTGAPKTGASEQVMWVADRWLSSAKSVVKDSAMDAVRQWGEEASKAAAAARTAATMPSQQVREKGLVIRIFGRWPVPGNWVNIANLPLAGDWREQALRLLLPSAKDVQDVPLLGPLSEQALTAVVSGQVGRAVRNSTWGALTTDVWKVSSSAGKPFEIGYEVVEVESQDKDEMCNMARASTPGRVIPVNPDLKSLIDSLEPS